MQESIVFSLWVNVSNVFMLKINPLSCCLKAPSAPHTSTTNLFSNPLSPTLFLIMPSISCTLSVVSISILIFKLFSPSQMSCNTCPWPLAMQDQSSHGLWSIRLNGPLSVPRCRQVCYIMITIAYSMIGNIDMAVFRSHSFKSELINLFLFRSFFSSTNGERSFSSWQ